MRTSGVVFAITLAVIVASAGLTYRAGNEVLRLNQAEQQRREAIVAAGDFFSALQDAETGQRGYIITGDEAYLEPFHRAEEKLPSFTRRFRDFAGIGIAPEQARALETVVKEKMTELRSTVQQRQSRGFAAAAATIEGGTGKTAMDRIRQIFSAIRAEQEKQLQQDEQRSTAATKTRTATFVFTAVLTLLVLLWGYWRIRRAILQRDSAAREQEREAELLSTTLSSIGDCVIVTDIEGRITFMNHCACAVTGWTAEEASQRPIKEIFHIINEESRLPVEDPVERVIRSGVTVGLANHTLLVRKDGTEIPIDDSGAPVPTRDGKLEGVVLVFRDFSENKKAERDLVAARDEAERANKTKDTFLAMLSHELRTPLTPVLATLQGWEVADQVPESLRNDVSMLRRNVELEARLIDDLLDLARISRGVLSFEPVTVDVHRLIHLVASLTRSDAAAKSIQIALKLDATQYCVKTDPSRLQQVLWNILRNALNYTDAHGNVTVQTTTDGQSILIRMSDSGVGMSRETLDRLFIPFGQADRSRSLHYGGLGLGLAISHSLVLRMGGELTARSAGLGRGSQFTIRLPALPAPVTGVFPALPSVSSIMPPRRILLVEDHADTAWALARLLRMRGHEVSTASSVAAARAAVDGEQFDLVLCDIGLPDGTGYDFISGVRKRSDVPAIAVTGFGMQADVERAQAAGFHAHLTKPVDLVDLERAMMEAESRQNYVLH